MFFVEEEKSELGKKVLEPYRRGKNPGKPKTRYLEHSDAESSSDEDESSTYDKKVSIKISSNAKFLMIFLTPLEKCFSKGRPKLS